MLWNCRTASRHTLQDDEHKPEVIAIIESRQTSVGLILPQLHAIAHLLVFFPCTRSFTAKLCMPASLMFLVMISTLLYLPSMLVYHWHRSLNILLSLTIAFTKATSPPGVTISTSAPVHAERGGRDLEAAEATRSVEDS